MTEFICGRAGSGKSSLLLERIKQTAGKGKKVFLIVPEQQAVEWERVTATELEPSVLTGLEVVTFTRLADRVSREYGGFSFRYATKQAKRLIMWAALSAVRENLTYYKTARSDKLVPAFLSVLRELKTYGVTPETLASLSDDVREDGDPRSENLSGKLSDLASVAAAYDSILGESFDDSDSLPEKTARIIAERHFFRDSYVFADSFYSLTPAQSDVMAAAFCDAESVTMTFDCPANDGGEVQFRHIRNYLDRMKETAEAAGGYTVTALDENRRAETEMLRTLERDLWRYSAPASDEDDGSVRVYYARDLYDEAAIAAETVRALAHDGERYGNVAVVARSAESRYGITDRVMQRAGIPFYTSRRRELAESASASLILAALRAVCYGWRREDVVAMTKTGLIPAERENCDLFEKYVNTWRLRGRRDFSPDGEWYKNPDGYGKMHESGEAVLRAVNGVKDAVCVPLAAFAETFDGGSASARGVASALYKLLTDYGVPETLKERASLLRAAGYTLEAAEELRMWDGLMEALDALAMTLPDMTGDAESYLGIITEVLRATNVGTIPTGIDEVVFGSADMLRTGGTRHLIILGATDGEFPARLRDDGILSDSERLVLEDFGVRLSESGELAAAKELFWFYNAAAAPSRSLTVIVPAVDGGEAPSSGVQRIFEIFPSLKDKTEPPLRDEIYGIWSRGDAEAKLAGGADGALAEAVRRVFGDPAADGWQGDGGKISRGIIPKMTGGVLELSQTRIERYVECPFSFVGSSVLRLEEEKDARLRANDTGTFIHAVLEGFVNETKDREFPIPADELAETVDRLVDRQADELWKTTGRTTRQEYLLTRLRRNALVFITSLNEELADSSFRPLRCEQKVDSRGEGAIPAPEIVLEDGTRVHINGVIDRVDVMTRPEGIYVRIVDYKTMPKEFRLRDIEEGFDLQLLLYLFTIWKGDPAELGSPFGEGRTIIPAGVEYMGYSPDKGSEGMMLPPGEGLTVSAANVKRSGIAVDGPGYAEEMQDENSGVKPVGVDEFERLYGTITDTVRRIGEDMNGGEASASPKRHAGKSPCTYCPYLPVCRRPEAIEMKNARW